MSASDENSEGFRRGLLEALKEHPEGLTIEDLSRLMKAHRQTVTKYILWLEGAGKIHRRRIGAVTLHYTKRQWERLKK